MAEYKLKTGKTGQAVADAYKKVEGAFADKFLDEEGNLKTGGMADKVTGAYKTVEDTVVGTYKTMEDTVVGAYKKVENAFVDAFLEKAEDEPAQDGQATETDDQAK